MTDKLTPKRMLALKAIMWFSGASLCAAVLSLAGLFLYLDPQVPKAETYRNVQLETPLRIFSEDGGLLAEFGERRLIPITLDDVPDQFVNALLDTEDKRFYEHSGIDFISLANDSVGLIGSLLTDSGPGSGASTITMQLARNVSFSLERRFLRKFKEMLLALKIERELSKEEILELYINVVPFGKRAYGAEAAARTYYGKPLAELSLAQLAMLAGIPQAPTAGNPINGPERALARRNLVLSRMLDQESITEADYELARSEPITARIYARELDVPAPYVAEWARSLAFATIDDLYTGGYEIFTTVIAKDQARANTAMRDGLIAYDQRHGYRGPESTLPEDTIAELASANDLLDTDGLPASLRDTIHGALNALPEYGSLPAAAVLRVTDEAAHVQLASGITTQIDFATADWARPYISVDRRGRPPESFGDVLNVGDIVRVQPLVNTAEATETKDEEAIEDSAAPEPRWRLSQLPEVEGALISLDPNNSKVRALVGGFDFYRNQYNHALQAARQPGSGFKPFVYSAALNQGITPADIFMDAPLVFDDANLESQYRPDNDNNAYNGPTRLREALYRSINLVSMRVLLKVGAGEVIDHAERFGFDTRSFPRNTQLALGGGTMTVTPMDMAKAYAVFSNGGFMIDPYIIDSIKTDDGDVLYQPTPTIVCRECELEALAESESSAENPLDADGFGATLDEVEPSSLEALLAETPQPTEAPAPDEDLPTAWVPPQPLIAERVLDERNAFIMHSMLKDVVLRGTGRRAMALERNDLAGKTGTTNEGTDTWFNGYTAGLVTTVWVGFTDNQPLGARAFGANTALPIWVDYMATAVADTPQIGPPQPPGVASRKIDPETGELAAPGQVGAMFEYFLAEYVPARKASPVQKKPDEVDVKPIDLF